MLARAYVPGSHKLGIGTIADTMPIPAFQAATRQAPAPPDDRVQRTVWIGGLPSTMASEAALRSVMQRVGGVQSAHVRKKEGVNKNWALVLFAQAEHARCLLDEKDRVSKLGLASTAGWCVQMVEPTKLRSLEAQFTVRFSSHQRVHVLPGRVSASKNLGLSASLIACELLTQLCPCSDFRGGAR